MKLQLWPNPRHRHQPLLRDNPDRSKDNPHRKEPENLNNLYGCSVEMDYPSWGQRRLPATRLFSNIVIVMETKSGTSKVKDNDNPEKPSD